MDELNTLIQDLTRNIQNRRLNLSRLEDRFEAPRGRRYDTQPWEEFLKEETGEDNFEQKTRELEDELRDAEEEREYYEVKEEEEKAKEVGDKEKAEEDRQQKLPGIERTSMEKADTKIPGFGDVIDAVAKAELLKQAAQSRLGKKAATKAAVKLLGGMAAKRVLGPYSILLDLLPTMEATRKKDEGI